ncbi:hypothetical protein PZB74_02765 [Porifericola rhodea]|uniref:hypothetical protein n=1 Tax=Porifericola rhodea TaxID=930972 RepID=UPI00266607F5|nr:hypothetical protein [Porifericola rhodea]WKN32274.1 hypothetical protein PZB74_02765 [Porifericola rhodea]
MSKETERLDEQKEILFDALASLQDSIDLDEEDIQKLKEWGAGLLVAGVSAYVVYKILKSAFKGRSLEFEERDNNPLPKVKMKKESKVSRLIREQLIVILIAVFRKRIMQFLRDNNLIDED